MSRSSLSDMAYDQIKRKIIYGHYPPNEMISESIICEEINSSRTPVREAINKLEQDNLVKVVYKKGIMVKDITLNDIKLIFETRLLIEPYAVRNYGVNLDKEYLKILWERMQHFESREQSYKIDDELHMYLVHQTGNVYLINTMRAIYDHNMRLRILAGEKVNARMESTEIEHREIFNSLFKGDFEAAATYLTIHLEKSREASYKMMLSEYNLNLR
ncbi:DNA-binding transcriptional regulator, GntR family [Proteiniclasticum ruminis]|uniref:DNA-binding transcriptional regulator, GntR family n=2 Tax=Proteiniclasticum ruminis TaxID=398199 RepID=A0A1G8K899_9CLOT|nr:DNA-binding transcriptional regulator, GntR family [Proteiniclasticum ruminis]